MKRFKCRGRWGGVVVRGGGAGRGCESSLETLPSENESESESLPRRGEVFGFLKDYRHLRKVNRTLLKYPIGTFFFFFKQPY